MNSSRHDSDAHKGAVENERAGEESNTSMRGQLSHREQDPQIKGSDSDYPEPGLTEEHTGERTEQQKKSAETGKQPGVSQKTNQNQQKEDPLAS